MRSGCFGPQPWRRQGRRRLRQLAVAQLMLDGGRPKEAADLLEHMILGFPDSALVPQARRLLDQARGAVPRT